jgi:hypothetical protein
MLLAPLFLLGLVALAVPVLVHLTQRQQARVVAFPSLMFVKRIPFETTRRRRLRDLLLLAMRALALVLVVVAFARPFWPQPPEVLAAEGARELVLLVDRSYSLRADGQWARVQAAVSAALDEVRPGDRVSLVSFADRAELLVRASLDMDEVRAAAAALRPGDGATAYGGALKVAAGVLAESPLPRREAVLVSDFQQIGWSPEGLFRLPPGAAFRPVVIPASDAANVAVAPLTIERQVRADAPERLVVTGTARRRAGAGAPARVAMTLEVDGRAVQTDTLSFEGRDVATVVFAPVVRGRDTLRVTTRVVPDAQPADDAFHAVVGEAPAIDVLVIGPASGEAADGGRDYLGRALSIGDRPRVVQAAVPADAVTAERLAAARVVILQDVVVGDGLAVLLRAFVESGGGLVMLAGARMRMEGEGVWPVTLQGEDDHGRDGARLVQLAYGHPVFESFRAPRSGDFSTVRVRRSRRLAARPGDQVLAWFSTGRPALVEGVRGRGRVLVAALPVGDAAWSDLPLKPAFLPFVHELMRHAAGYRPDAGWLTVGEAVDTGVASSLVVGPDGTRQSPPDGSTVVPVDSAGFHEVRGPREAQPLRVVAVNVNPREAEPQVIDPEVMRLALTGGSDGGVATAPAAAVPSPEAQEQQQRWWWYLLAAGMLLLAVESWWSGRLAPLRPEGVRRP